MPPLYNEHLRKKVLAFGRPPRRCSRSVGFWAEESVVLLASGDSQTSDLHLRDQSVLEKPKRQELDRFVRQEAEEIDPGLRRGVLQTFHRLRDRAERDRSQPAHQFLRKAKKAEKAFDSKDRSPI